MSEKLVAKYIAATEYVLEKMVIKKNPVTVHGENVMKIVAHAKAYCDDAKYYRNKKRFEVSLASVAYCEGLLDALKLLGAVKFKWPKRRKKEK